MWKMMRGQTQEAYAAYQRQAPYLKSMVAPGPNYDRVVEWAVTSDRIAVADAARTMERDDLVIDGEIVADHAVGVEAVLDRRSRRLPVQVRRGADRGDRLLE